MSQYFYIPYFTKRLVEGKGAVDEYHFMKNYPDGEQILRENWGSQETIPQGRWPCLKCIELAVAHKCLRDARKYRLI